MDVAIMGPKAPAANLAEFTNPIVPPLGSVAKMEMINGIVAAMSPV